MNGQALTGLVRSAEEGPMEGVLVSAQRANTPVTITVVTDASWTIQLSSHPPRSRPLHAPRPRNRLRSGRSRTHRHRRQQDRLRRPEARQDQGPRLAALQRRVAHEHARPGRPEGLPAQLRQLPSPGLHHALAPHLRRIHPGDGAHEHLRQSVDAPETAAPQGGTLARRSRREPPPRPRAPGRLHEHA